MKLLIQLADGFCEKGHSHAGEIKKWVTAVDKRYRDFSLRMDKYRCSLEKALGISSDSNKAVSAHVIWKILNTSECFFKSLIFMFLILSFAEQRAPVGHHPSHSSRVRSQTARCRSRAKRGEAQVGKKKGVCYHFLLVVYCHISENNEQPSLCFIWLCPLVLQLKSLWKPNNCFQQGIAQELQRGKHDHLALKPIISMNKSISVPVYLTGNMHKYGSGN